MKLRKIIISLGIFTILSGCSTIASKSSKPNIEKYPSGDVFTTNIYNVSIYKLNMDDYSQLSNFLTLSNGSPVIKDEQFISGAISVNNYNSIDVLMFLDKNATLMDKGSLFCPFDQLQQSLLTKTSDGCSYNSVKHLIKSNKVGKEVLFEDYSSGFWVYGDQYFSNDESGNFLVGNYLYWKQSILNTSHKNITSNDQYLLLNYKNNSLLNSDTIINLVPATNYYNKPSNDYYNSSTNYATVIRKSELKPVKITYNKPYFHKDSSYSCAIIDAFKEVNYTKNDVTYIKFATDCDESNFTAKDFNGNVINMYKFRENYYEVESSNFSINLKEDKIFTVKDYDNAE